MTRGSHFTLPSLHKPRATISGPCNPPAVVPFLSFFIFSSLFHSSFELGITCRFFSVFVFHKECTPSALTEVIEHTSKCSTGKPTFVKGCKESISLEISPLPYYLSVYILAYWAIWQLTAIGNWRMHTLTNMAREKIWDNGSERQTHQALDKGARPICYSLRCSLLLYIRYSNHTHSLSCIYVIAKKAADVNTANYVGASSSSMAHPSPKPFEAIQLPYSY